MRIFEAFTPEEPALTVSEISRRTRLHVATASRMVTELDAGRRPPGQDRYAHVGAGHPCLAHPVAAQRGHAVHGGCP
ncbi:helix-turn-helix domain-containing protein [Streptomyces canus]|uniref:helix-turn-helix domain-containing protein n=1 Tax=Streptomyces canus TaxID=58343 RepID=UPI0033A6C46A